TSPTVTASSFYYQTAPRQIRFTFSEDVFDSLTTSSLLIKNLSTSATFNPTSLSYDFDTNTASFNLPAALADANYTATLQHANTKDLAGNALAADQAIPFFILTGDLNHDGTVSIADFITLASNFNKSPATYSE